MFLNIKYSLHFFWQKYQRIYLIFSLSRSSRSFFLSAPLLNLPYVGRVQVSSSWQPWRVLPGCSRRSHWKKSCTFFRENRHWKTDGNGLTRTKTNFWREGARKRKSSVLIITIFSSHRRSQMHRLVIKLSTTIIVSWFQFQFLQKVSNWTLENK